MIELLPPELGPLTGLALLGISFLGSFITAAFGIGGGVVSRKVLMKIDEKRFKLALNGILILLPLRLIWAGASTYL